MLKVFKMMLVGTALISVASAKRIQNDSVIGMQPFSFQPQMREAAKDFYGYENSWTMMRKAEQQVLSAVLKKSIETKAQEDAARALKTFTVGLSNEIWLSVALEKSFETKKQEDLRRIQPALNSFNQATDDLFMQMAIRNSLETKKEEDKLREAIKESEKTYQQALNMAIRNSLQTKEEEDLKAAIEASKETFKQETLKRMQERSKPSLRQTVYEQNPSLAPSFSTAYPRLDMFTSITVDSQDSLGNVRPTKTFGIQPAKFREQNQNDKVDLLKNSSIEDRQLLEMDVLEELPVFDLPVVPVVQGVSQSGIIPPAPPAPPVFNGNLAELVTLPAIKGKKVKTFQPSDEYSQALNDLNKRQAELVQEEENYNSENQTWNDKKVGMSFQARNAKGSQMKKWHQQLQQKRNAYEQDKTKLEAILNKEKAEHSKLMAAQEKFNQRLQKTVSNNNYTLEEAIMNRAQLLKSAVPVANAAASNSKTSKFSIANFQQNYDELFAQPEDLNDDEF